MSTTTPRASRLSVPLLVLTAVVALVLGATGAATAGSLTKGAVKKIAAKVVKKQAPSLSVASAATATTATTAGNATNLNGQPASAYQDGITRFALVSTTLSTNKNWTLTGLAAGTYAVHYHIALGNGPTAAGDCYMTATGAPTTVAFGYGATFSTAATWDNSAVLTVPAGGTITIHCDLSGNVSTFASAPSFAEATPLDTVTTGVATANPARPQARPADGGPPRP